MLRIHKEIAGDNGFTRFSKRHTFSTLADYEINVKAFSLEKIKLNEKEFTAHIKFIKTYNGYMFDKLIKLMNFKLMNL